MMLCSADDPTKCEDGKSSRAYGACGGGRIWLVALQKIDISGSIFAKGQDADARVGGAGSGGSVVLNATRVHGSGVVSVEGGGGYPRSSSAATAAPDTFTSGGGGGGRISILCDGCGAVSESLDPSGFQIDPNTHIDQTSQETLVLKAKGGAAGMFVTTEPDSKRVITEYGIGGSGTRYLSKRDSSSQTLTTFSTNGCVSSPECAYPPSSTYISAKAEDGLVDLVLSASNVRSGDAGDTGAPPLHTAVIVSSGAKEVLTVSGNILMGVNFGGSATQGTPLPGVAIDLLYTGLRTSFALHMKAGGSVAANNSQVGRSVVGGTSPVYYAASVQSVHISADEAITLLSSIIFSENDGVRTTLHALRGDVSLLTFPQASSPTNLVSTSGEIEVVSAQGKVIFDNTPLPMAACLNEKGTTNLEPSDLAQIKVSVIATACAVAAGAGVEITGTICIFPLSQQAAATAGSDARETLRQYLNRTSVEIYSKGNVSLVANIRANNGGLVLKSGDTIDIATDNMTGTFVSIDAADSIIIAPIQSGEFFHISALPPTIGKPIAASDLSKYADEVCIENVGRFSFLLLPYVYPTCVD